MIQQAIEAVLAELMERSANAKTSDCCKEASENATPLSPFARRTRLTGDGLWARGGQQRELQSHPNQRLVDVYHRFDQRVFSVTHRLLPSEPPVRFFDLPDGRRALQQRVSGPARNRVRTRRNDHFDRGVARVLSR